MNLKDCVYDYSVMSVSKNVAMRVWNYTTNSASPCVTHVVTHVVADNVRDPVSFVVYTNVFLVIHIHMQLNEP